MREPRKKRARKSESLPEFEASPPKTRRAQVAETLRNFVLSGRLKPGTQLIESRLVESLGVSRSSIREAIWELIDQGLLVNRPYAGTFVVSIDEKAMADLFSLRGAIERFCFTELWPRRDETFRAEFTQHHAMLARAIRSRKRADIVAAEMAFHTYPYAFSGNQALLAVWAQLSKKIQLGFVISQGVTRDGAFIDHSRAYLDHALGNDLSAMLREIDRHLAHGLEDVRRRMRDNEGEEGAAPARRAQ